MLQEGKRVYLREPVPGDEAEFLALREASRDFLRPWEPATDLDERVRFEGLCAANRDGRNRKMFLCRTRDDAIVGYFGINEIVRGPAQMAFLGYWTGASFARQGYMTEGLQLALREAFSVLGLHRVEANIIPRNRASIALVKRAGFRREGHSPRYLQIAGRWEDHERWALLADEWGQGSSGP